jgi:hypothetical protein
LKLAKLDVQKGKERFPTIEKHKMTLVAIIALSMVLAALPLATVHSNPDTTIYVSPASILNAVTNNDYTVYINVSDVADLYAWEFQLDYDSAILSLVSTSIVAGGLGTPTQTFKADNTTAGHLWFAVSTTYPTLTGISYGDHAIFKVKFHAIATGTSTLHLHGDILADHNGNPIAHSPVDGSITVGTLDLTVTSVVVIDHGCSIYANDNYSDGVTKFYVPVNVTIHNTGTMDAGAFNVSLAVYSITYSVADGSGELRVASLAAGASVTLQFTAVFHPTHTHYYQLTATVDNHNEVVESDETNNALVYKPGTDGIKVTVIGDINGDTTVSILDAVTIAQAWGATSTDTWYNIKADINHDNKVNILDGTKMTLVGWGATW